MKIRVWRWVNDFLLVDYPFKTQIGLSNKIRQQKQKSFNWRQFCHSNFNPRSCHTSHHIFLFSHLSRWQHRKWETVLRTASWLNQLSEVCLLSVCKENLVWGDMDLDELLPGERNAALYAKKRLIPRIHKMPDLSVLTTKLVNPQPFAIQFSCWGFGSDTVHQACLFDSG